MPTSIAAAAVGAIVANSATVIAALGTVGAAVAGGMAAVGVSAIFAKKPQQPMGLESGRMETIRQPVAPWQVIYGETRVGGTITFMESVDLSDNDRNTFLEMVVTLSGHELAEISKVYFDDEEVPLDSDGSVPSGRFFGFAEVHKSLGNEAGQPFPALVARSAGKWTDAHRQSGRGKLYVRLGWNQDTYANGIPKITARVKGKKVYDPRTEQVVWSDNPALCIADWLCDPDVGLGCDYDTEIDEDQLIAAANICDEEVTKADGSTEKRYTMNGAFQAGGTPRETLGRLLTAMNGHARFIGGKWKLYPAAYATPEITLTADDLRGPLHIIPRVSRRDLCNGVKGLYASPDNFWQPTDFPPIASATYLEEDQGERIWRELDLPFTDSPSMAQRIAKIELERVRQQIVVEWPGQLGCYRLQPGDTVKVTLDRYGWSEKVFEVLSTRLVFEEAGEHGGVILGCDLVLKETAAAVYDWNSGEETTVDPAPDTNLPDAFTVGVPGNPSVSEELYETRDGRGVGAKATASWAAPTDPFVAYYQLEYREEGETDWIVFPLQTSRTLSIFDIAPGTYDFRVKAINNLGVSSSYATTSGVEIKGLGARPSAPTGVTLQVAGGTAIITLDEHPDLDVKRGGRILVRHTEATSDQAWEESLSIGHVESWPGDSVLIVLPLKAGSYLLKARDSSGQESESFAVVVTKQASVLAYSTLDTLTEDPTFGGTHSDTVVDSGALQLDVDGSDVIASGTYTFSAGFDFASVKRVRVTGQIEGIVFNVNDLIDDRIDNIDDWLDFDGDTGIGSAADAWLECRETDDDPDGTPTWSEWKRVDSAEFECRAMEFRLQLRSFDPAYNIQIETLRVKAEEVT